MTKRVKSIHTKIVNGRTHAVHYITGKGMSIMPVRPKIIPFVGEGSRVINISNKVKKVL